MFKRKLYQDLLLWKNKYASKRAALIEGAKRVGKETLRDISKAIRSRLKPECEFEVNEKSSDDGRTFIEVYFSGNRAPYSADGKYFLRFSDEDKQMTNQELDKFFQNLKKIILHGKKMIQMFL